MLKKIDHIGIAVTSIEEAIPFYEKALGLKCEQIEEVASQKVKTAFLLWVRSTSSCWSPHPLTVRWQNFLRKMGKEYTISHMVQMMSQIN